MIIPMLDNFTALHKCLSVARNRIDELSKEIQKGQLHTYKLRAEINQLKERLMSKECPTCGASYLPKPAIIYPRPPWAGPRVEYNKHFGWRVVADCPLNHHQWGTLTGPYAEQEEEAIKLWNESVPT